MREGKKNLLVEVYYLICDGNCITLHETLCHTPSVIPTRVRNIRFFHEVNFNRSESMTRNRIHKNRKIDSSIRSTLFYNKQFLLKYFPDDDEKLVFKTLIATELPEK